VAFEREEIRVLDDDYLKHELLSFESNRLASGGFQYKALAGSMRSPCRRHGNDCVTRKPAGTFGMALAIAWDSLRVMERRFEGVTIEGKDPVEEIDRGEL